MGYFERLVEDKILEAQREGAFDNLPGKGKPLPHEDNAFVPEDLRLSYKILKNARCLPPELELRAEIYSLRQLLNAAIDKENRREIARDLNYRLLKLNLLRERIQV